MTFRAGDLRQVRRVTAEWAARAGLTGSRAGGFVSAVSEIAANAVRPGSPAARLLLSVTGTMAVAEVRASGRWPGAEPAGSAARASGTGLPPGRRICDGAEIRVERGGTMVRLRMRLDAPAG